MTFEQFQATRTKCEDLCALVGGAGYLPSATGHVYVNHFIIEDVTDRWNDAARGRGKYHTRIGGQDRFGFDLEALERELFAAIGTEREMSAACWDQFVKWGEGVNDPVAAFIGKKAEFDALIERLTQLSSNHFGVAPDDINWGHVTVLAGWVGRLQEISDAAHKEGEYAIRPRTGILLSTPRTRP